MNDHAVITFSAFATGVPLDLGDDETTKTLRNAAIYNVLNARRDINLTQCDVMMCENGERAARSGMEVLERSIASVKSVLRGAPTRKIDVSRHTKTNSLWIKK